MNTLIPLRIGRVASVAMFVALAAAAAQAATKERVYPMGDNDPGATVGQKPPVGSSGRIQTEDIQPSTTDFRGTDPPAQVNVSLVPLKSFNANFAPTYVLASDRPGAVAGNFALEFDGVNDNMFSDSFDPRDFEGGFAVLAQAWVKPTSASFTSPQFIFRIGAENGGVSISANGLWTLRTGNVATPPDLFEVESSVAAVPNQWTHVAVVRGGNDSALYVNGSIAARDTGFWGADGPEVTVGGNTFGTDSLFKGVIDNFNVASLVGGFDSGIDVDYFADNDIAFTGVAGDIDQDGLVNDADYVIWSDNVGFTNGVGQGDAGTLLIGDADRSGRIDLWDFRIIQQAALAAGTPLTRGVPEPSSAALLLTLGALAACRRGRRRAKARGAATAALAMAAVLVMQASSTRAAVVVGDDFLYDGPSKVLHVGGGFTGNSRYVGGQNGAAGRWTGLWGQIGDGIITTPQYTPPDPPGTPEPGTPIHAALYDGFFGVQSELFRGFELADSVSPTQTLYFGGRFKVDLDIGSDGGTVPQFYAPRLFLNRVGGDDRYFDINNIPLPTQRDRTQDIAVGIESFRNVNTLSIENMIVARLGAGPEAKTTVVAAPPSDGNWHTVVGKLELNVSGGANERLTVWLDATGVESGGTMTQVEADVLPDLTALIGTFHSQGARPVNPAMDPALPFDPADSLIDMPAELGRSYIDDMAIGTAWSDVATVNIPRLTLRINPTTGAGRLINGTGTTFALDGYSIESAGGALTPVGWNSLDDQNVGNWLQNLATSNGLVETSFLGAAALAPGGQIALGNVFAVGGMQDVVGRYSTQDGLINLLNVEFSSAGLTGDYDLDGDVDGRDFLVWQRTLGTNVTPGSGADGDGNGSIGAGDLTVWRNNFGQTLAVAAAGVVPEPGAALLGLSATLCAVASRSRRI